MRQVGISPDPLANVQPVGIRQHDIENDQIGPLALAQLDLAFTGLGADEYEAFFFKVVLQQRKQIGIILNQYNLFHQTVLSSKIPRRMLQMDYEAVTSD
jgi:hypothetical protein